MVPRRACARSLHVGAIGFPRERERQPETLHCVPLGVAGGKTPSTPSGAGQWAAHDRGGDIVSGGEGSPSSRRPPSVGCLWIGPSLLRGDRRSHPVRDRGVCP